jgi:hypothetical protein
MTIVFTSKFNVFDSDLPLYHVIRVAKEIRKAFFSLPHAKEDRLFHTYRMPHRSIPPDAEQSKRCRKQAIFRLYLYSVVD